MSDAPSSVRPTGLARRHALGAFGSLSALALAACGGGNSDTSSNAALAGLSPSAGALSPAFASSTLQYTLAVANSVSSLTFTPTAGEASATIRVNGVVVTSGTASTAISLAVGANTVSIVVTAPNGASTQTYTIAASRASASASADASLSALSLSEGALSPAFAAGTSSYVASLPNTASTVTVTATSTSAAATIRVNNVAVGQGQPSGSIAVPVGTSNVVIVVTAEDGTTTRTYTVAVTRAATSVSADATLSGLVLSAGTLSPTFTSGTVAYTATVANAVSSITVLATTQQANATLTVNGLTTASGSNSGAVALVVGANTITVRVLAQDASTALTYTIVVTRADAAVSNVATLSALTISSGSLSPSFASTTTSYTATVANSVSSITVTPVATGSGARIAVGGSTVASGSASGALALAVGSNTVSIVVTAADGVTTATYTLAVTRSAAGTCTLTATETQGPYPLLAILSNTAMVRNNITESKTGVPLRLTLKLQDLSAGCAAISGAAIYIWHCDKDGLYSGYSVSNNAGQAGLTYLRGIQLTDSNGEVTFTTIYPGWYAGRITHIHVQVYLNNNLAVTATATTQLAFPQDVTTTVYNSSLYTKGQNTSVTSFAADNVFSDGTSTEMVAISGNTTSGYDATMTLVIA